jgi:hypothetical protein
MLPTARNMPGVRICRRWALQGDGGNHPEERAARLNGAACVIGASAGMLVRVSPRLEGDRDSAWMALRRLSEAEERWHATHSTDTKLKVGRVPSRSTRDIAPNLPVSWLQLARGTGSTTYGRDSLVR